MRAVLFCSSYSCNLGSILQTFFTAGGPPAHLGFYQRRFIEAKQWIPYSAFAELIALAQCLPGPSSTQVAFALGALRRGVPGGLLTGVCFQHAGLILMSLAGIFGAKLSTSGDETTWLDALTNGLSSGGIGLVIDASFNLVTKLCQTPLTQVICALATSAAYLFTKPWLLPLLIVGGGIATALHDRFKNPASDEGESNSNEQAGNDGDEGHESVTRRLGLSPKAGAGIVVAWLVLLGGTGIASSLVPYRKAPELHWASSFVRVGSFIFGGGFVAMPLLISELEAGERNLVSNKEFLLGLSLVQSAPGPLFNLSAYLGAIIAQNQGRPVMLGIIICWTGLFLPGVLLIFAALSFWSTFRRWQLYRDALRGFNAGAAGLLCAAAVQLYHRVRGVSPFGRVTTFIVVLVFAAVRIMKVPAPAGIVAGGVAGLVAFAIQNAG